MMQDGHEQRTRAILEHLARKSVEKETRVEQLPKEMQELLLEMADTIRKHEQEIFELKSTVGAFGAVTLNDLLKKSA